MPNTEKEGKRKHPVCLFPGSVKSAQALFLLPISTTIPTPKALKAHRVLTVLQPNTEQRLFWFRVLLLVNKKQTLRASLVESL